MKITADHLRDSINEIELELKSGNPTQLFQFALEIAPKVREGVGGVYRLESPG